MYFRFQYAVVFPSSLLPLLLCCKSIKCLSPSTTPPNRFDQGNGHYSESVCAGPGTGKNLECPILSSMGSCPEGIPGVWQQTQWLPVWMCLEVQPLRTGTCLDPPGAGNGIGYNPAWQSAGSTSLVYANCCVNEPHLSWAGLPGQDCSQPPDFGSHWDILCNSTTEGIVLGYGAAPQSHCPGVAPHTSPDVAANKIEF